MVDSDGDNIWTLTVPLFDGSYEYKYALGNWVSQETVPGTCDNTIGANRAVTVAADMTLATDVYSGCPADNDSGGSDPVQKNVTFSVDMTGVDLSDGNPTLQGTFNDWCGLCSPMSDDDGDNIWTLTVPLNDGAYEYKYALGEWVSQESVPGTCDNTIGANRAVTVSADVTLATDVYSGCPGDNDDGGDTGGDTGGNTDAGGGSESNISVLDFEGPLNVYVFADIGPDANPGSNSAIVQDPDDATNSVVMSTRVGNTTTYNGLWFTESEDGGSIDTYEFESGDTVVSMRVRSPAAGKTVLLKFEVDDNAAISTVATAQTTVANQWETLSFDFAADVDFDVSYGKVVVIYDFEGSVDQADQIFYFDDLTYVSSTDSDTGSTDSDTGSTDSDTGSSATAPTPTVDAASVLSIFSDAYTDLEGTNFNPDWGQTGTVATDGGVLTYSNLNYQGTEFSGAQDVSGYESVHVDFYSADAQTLKFFLVGAGETAYDLPVAANTWVSVDIPLTAFTGVDLTQVIQFKVDANPNSGVTVLFDNLYFHSADVTETGTDTGSDTGTVAAGELITNGTFETGDLSGWTVDATSAGTLAVVNTVNNGGDYSLNLSVMEIQDAVIKAAGLAAGELTMGQSVTVSFDVKGEISDGGVIFAQFYYEGAAGVSNGNGALGNGLAPLAVSNSWSTFSYDETLDSDVSAGVTLQLKASCGAVAGCAINAYIDNVSVIVN